MIQKVDGMKTRKGGFRLMVILISRLVSMVVVISLSFMGRRIDGDIELKSKLLCTVWLNSCIRIGAGTKTVQLFLEENLGRPLYPSAVNIAKSWTRNLECYQYHKQCLNVAGL
jgi:hypothetical protein